MNPTKYVLRNVADGHVFKDSYWCLNDPSSPRPSLVRAEYGQKKFIPDTLAEGLYRYHDWLPVTRCLTGSCAPVTFKAERLGARLGLNNLHVTFSGWWPEKGAFFKTCSFKETEAYSVCGRLDENEKRTLVVASAGNTARAFAHVCSMNRIPLVICIPFDNLDALWFDTPLNPCVKVLATPSGSDYFDAIALGDQLCKKEGFFAEGGAKNIARRDGMGTTLLSFVEKNGRIPDFYFQAIGSGTGAIAVWENNMRLVEDGSFGTTKMRIIASQNAPFTIMYDSWKKSGRELVPFTAERAREASALIDAKVLSNRKPPYSLAGGMYDALVDTHGDIISVTNEELSQYGKLFAELEGCDINNAAAVATASLALAVKNGTVHADDCIMLNITGGGEKKRINELQKDGRLHRVQSVKVYDAQTEPDKIEI